MQNQSTRYGRSSLFEEVTFSKYPANTKTANNKGPLFWHISAMFAVKNGKIRGKYLRITNFVHNKTDSQNCK